MTWYDTQGDGIAAADTARGELCASADDERHAHGNDAKHRWVQSAAEDGNCWWGGEDRYQWDK